MKKAQLARPARGLTRAAILVAVLLSGCTSDISSAIPGCVSPAAGACRTPTEPSRGSAGFAAAPITAEGHAGTSGSTLPSALPDAGIVDAGVVDAGAADAGSASQSDASIGAHAGESGSQTTDAGKPNTSSGAEVPMTDHCADAANWNPDWVSFETEVLRLTNEARASGADCHAEGKFAATMPLTMSPILRCSARLHSQDMGVRKFFDHENPDNLDPFQRMMAAGYVGSTMGENIAKGQQNPAEVVKGWLASDGHCRNMLDPNFTEIGVGYWEGKADSQFFNGNKLWTQNFGRPRTTRR